MAFSHLYSFTKADLHIGNSLLFVRCFHRFITCLLLLIRTTCFSGKFNVLCRFLVFVFSHFYHLPTFVVFTGVRNAIMEIYRGTPRLFESVEKISLSSWFHMTSVTLPSPFLTINTLTVFLPHSLNT
jgi:hypothetical protein